MKPYYHDEASGITIYHGDCREVLPSVSGDVLVTDPPYGVAHDPDYTRFSGGVSASRSTHAPVWGDDEPFDPRWLLAAAQETVLFGANCFSNLLPRGSWLVWDKRAPGGAKNVMSDAEVAWWSEGHGVYVFSHTWDGFNRASERGTAYHPTQKPVALMRWVLARCSAVGEVVLDPYMGSGPISAACAQMGRGYVGIEIEERYCEIAVKRLQQATFNLNPSEPTVFKPTLAI